MNSPSAARRAERSPFRPTFGVNPPTVAGRDAVIDAVSDALDDGPGSAGRAALATGVRGIGKTVVLNAVEDAARERGWLVISETLSPGLGDRLVHEHVPTAWRLLRGETAPDPTGPPTRRRLRGITLPASLGGVSFEHVDVAGLVGLRQHLSALADALEQRGSGLLVTVDEIHKTGGRAREDFETFAATFQHLWREEREIAFFGAGLPAAVQDLLNDDVITFLRRAERFDLTLLSDDDVADALRLPVLDAGRSIDEEALGLACGIAVGYPYLVQVVGDLAWKVDRSAPSIEVAHVDQVRGRAIRALGRQVHQPAVTALSEKDTAMLTAMLPDAPGPSRMRDLLVRLGVDHAYASRYRARLIAAGMVRPDGRGSVRYDLPYLADYLETL